MSDEKDIEYDYGNSISFVTSLQAICGLMGGFIFTGTTVILAGLGEPVTLLAQFVLFVLSAAMGMFTAAMFELNTINNLVCWDSPKRIIPFYPARWRKINTTMSLGAFLAMISIPLMFLLKNLTLLFVLSMCTTVLGFIWSLYSWKSAKEEVRARRNGILQ